MRRRSSLSACDAEPPGAARASRLDLRRSLPADTTDAKSAGPTAAERIRRSANPPGSGRPRLAGHSRRRGGRRPRASGSPAGAQRDRMHAESGAHLLDRASRALGATGAGASLAERLGREVWIDFVADTGDDYDLSVAVGRMVLSDHTLGGEEARRLPRGDVLVFGGDTAYPLSTGLRARAPSAPAMERGPAGSVPGPQEPRAPGHPRQSRLVRRPRRLRAPVPQEPARGPAGARGWCSRVDAR